MLGKDVKDPGSLTGTSSKADSVFGNLTDNLARQVCVRGGVVPSHRHPLLHACFEGPESTVLKVQQISHKVEWACRYEIYTGT